jgi:squalene-hopene/tetraprenyl-beta-curcumene cyclase
MIFLDDTSAVVRALTRIGESDAAVQRGIAWSAGMQSRDGGWDEPQYTGTGLPNVVYLLLRPVPDRVPAERAGQISHRGRRQQIRKVVTPW